MVITQDCSVICITAMTAQQRTTTWRDFGTKWSWLIEMVSQHLPGRAEEEHEHIRVADGTAEIRTGNIPISAALVPTVSTVLKYNLIGINNLGHISE